MPDVRVSADALTLSRDVASAVARTITRVVLAREHCSLVLSGGSTPRPMHRLLASTYGSAVPWSNVDVFWGDERFVPAMDPRSNFGTAQTDLLDEVPVLEERVHPIHTHLGSPQESAEAYGQVVRTFFQDRPQRFDLVLLGVGEDGHTASLFPHSPALHQVNRAAVATESPGDGLGRITLTLPVLTAAHLIFVVVSGSNKAEALTRALAPGTSIDDCPAAALRHAKGSVIWWVDRAAMP